MFLTNGRSEHCNNVIPDVDGVTVMVWKYPTLNGFTTLLMPSLEDANHHFQHRQSDINISLRCSEVPTYKSLVQMQLACEVHVFPTQSNNLRRPQSHQTGKADDELRVNASQLVVNDVHEFGERVVCGWLRLGLFEFVLHVAPWVCRQHPL